MISISGFVLQVHALRDVDGAFGFSRAITRVYSGIQTTPAGDRSLE
jgi:hypothetical protein